MMAQFMYDTTAVSTESSLWAAGGSGYVGNPGGGAPFLDMLIVDDPGTGCIP